MHLDRARVALLAVLGVVVVLLLAVLFWLRQAPSGPAAAVAALPADTLRVGYVDWSRVVEEVDAAGVEPGSVEARAVLDRLYERDLSVGSAQDTSLAELEAHFGVNPLEASWEVYGQGREGAVSVLAFPEDVDLAAVEEGLADLGYDAPADGAGKGGTWVGNPDQVAGLEPPLSPLQENLAVLTEERLLVMADAPGSVTEAVAVIRGEEDSLLDVNGVRDLVGLDEEATTVALWAGDFACESLTMAQADPSDAQRARELVDEVGGVSPLDGLVMAQRADGSLQVGLRYGSSEQASRDLQARVDLAAGEAVGQGGSFADRFTIADGYADGELVVLELTPVDGPFLGDLGQGPLLFATC